MAWVAMVIGIIWRPARKVPLEGGLPQGQTLCVETSF